MRTCWVKIGPETCQNKDGIVFCFACKLFGNSDLQSALTAGYRDWKNVAAGFAEHKALESHRMAMVAYIMLCMSI